MLTVVVALVALEQAFSFGGGSPNALAVALSKSGNESVAIFAQQEAIQKFSIKFSENEDRNGRIAKVLSLKCPEPAVAAFGPQSLPPFSLPKGCKAEEFVSYQQAFPDRASELIEVEDGQVKATPPKNGYIGLSGIESIKFGKPVRVHWFLRQFCVAAAVKKMPESEFLELLARSCIGRLVVMQEEYRVELDEKEFRSLYVRWALDRAVVCKDRSLYQRRDELRYLLAAEAMKAATVEQVRKLMSTPDGSILLNMPVYSKARQLARNYVNEWMDPSPWAGTVIEDQSILELVDFSKLPRIRLSADGGLLLLFSGKKPRSGVGL
jgi:hypothetical protein